MFHSIASKNGIDMQLGSTAVGIKTKEGVILTVEKRITSPLLVRWDSAPSNC